MMTLDAIVYDDLKGKLHLWRETNIVSPAEKQIRIRLAIEQTFIDEPREERINNRYYSILP